MTAADEGNGETMPAPRALRRDVLDDGEDVTNLTDRQLILRVANDRLVEAHERGALLGAMASMEGRIVARIEKLEGRLAPNGEIEHRAAMTSSHAIETAADTIASKLFAEFHGPRGGRNNLTKEAVVEIVQSQIDAGTLKQFRDAEKDNRKLRLAIKAGAVVAIVTVLATAIAAHLEGRATAPQQQTQTK